MKAKDQGNRVLIILTLIALVLTSTLVPRDENPEKKTVSLMKAAYADTTEGPFPKTWKFTVQKNKSLTDYCSFEEAIKLAMEHSLPTYKVKGGEKTMIDPAEALDGELMRKGYRVVTIVHPGDKFSLVVSG